jgi:hypothetical protein
MLVKLEFPISIEDLKFLFVKNLMLEKSKSRNYQCRKIYLKGKNYRCQKISKK